jgi:hypothetical protein
VSCYVKAEGKSTFWYIGNHTTVCTKLSSSDMIVFEKRKDISETEKKAAADLDFT